MSAAAVEARKVELQTLIEEAEFEITWAVFEVTIAYWREVADEARAELDTLTATDNHTKTARASRETVS